MKEKEPRISVRVSLDLKARLEAVTKNTGVDEATIVRNCLEAVCDSVEATGALMFPLEIHPPSPKPARRSNPSPEDPSLSFAAEGSSVDQTASKLLRTAAASVKYKIPRGSKPGT